MNYNLDNHQADPAAPAPAPAPAPAQDSASTMAAVSIAAPKLRICPGHEWDNAPLFSDRERHQYFHGSVHPDEICGTLLLRIARCYLWRALWVTLNVLNERLPGAPQIKLRAVTARLEAAPRHKYPDDADYKRDHDGLVKARRDAAKQAREARELFNARQVRSPTQQQRVSLLKIARN